MQKKITPRQYNAAFMKYINVCSNAAKKFNSAYKSGDNALIDDVAQDGAEAMEAAAKVYEQVSKEYKKQQKEANN